MASIFSLINLRLLSLIKALGDNPGNTNNVVKISDFLYFGAKMHPEMIKKLNQELLEKPEFVEIYQKDQNPQNHLEEDYKLEELLKYPAGTLGYEYASHMQKQHLSQKYYPKRKITLQLHFSDKGCLKPTIFGMLLLDLTLHQPVNLLYRHFI